MAKSSTKKSATSVDGLTFEQALKELQQIVEVLEGDAEPRALEDALNLFERGQALVTRCGALLEQAQLKVQKLTGESLVPFEEESE